MRRLGDILLARSAAHKASVAEGVRLQHGFRARLGEILSRYGLVPEREVTAALAEQARLPLVLLDTAPPDAALFSPGDVPEYRARHFIPWRRVEGVLTLATSEASVNFADWAAAHYGEPVALVISPPRDLRRALRQRGRVGLTRGAIFGLTRRFRHLSAAHTLTRRQMSRILLGLMLVAGFILLIPGEDVWFTLLVVVNLFYLATLAFKLHLYTVWRALSPPVPPLALDDAELPPYAILVPLYQESATTIRQLLRAIATLEYPPYLLDVKLICEEDDAATIQAVKEASPPEYCDLVLVPVSLPRTKPKACNVALAEVTAEFVVIFDAEDIPAPDQLKKAVANFRRLPREVACLQAPLNYYNRDENLLTRLFAIEYGVLFTLLLPALQSLSIPLPLGGTSNHLRTEVLREVGGWDAFNVTEDADLGIRLGYFGYRTAMLDSLTLEESPITLPAWLRQRARWIKGYLQTWLVYTRDTRALKARLGRVGYYGFHFFVGAPAITFLLAPFFWLLFFISAFGLLPTSLSPWLLWLCGVSLLGGILSHWLFARAILRAQGWGSARMRRAGLLFPFYWLLHSVAAIRALRDLALRPHHWEKTRHGLSRVLRG